MHRILILVLIFSLFGCSIFNKQNNNSYQVISFGNHSSNNSKGHKLFTNVKEWKNYISGLNLDINLESFSEIDFDKSNVLILFAGLKSSGGYGIEIDDYSVIKDKANISVFITTPKGHATMALTTPYKVIIVPKKIIKVTTDFLN